uniref:Pentatricopeptide repeat-containing protein n=1 Tax=Brassica campestris TaxID=3711 RepID=M4E4S1_BRACM
MWFSPFNTTYVKLSTLMDARRSFDDTRDPNVASIANLIRWYLKKHEFEEDLSLFKTMPERSIVTWNALIGGFGQTGRNEEAVSTFVDMVRESVLMPNELTFPCTIAAISNKASHGTGKTTHACTIKFNIMSLFVLPSLVFTTNVLTWMIVVWRSTRSMKKNEKSCLGTL